MGTLHHQPVDVYLPSGLWSLLSLPLFHTFSGIPPRHWRGHAPSCATGFGVWSSKHRLRPFWFVGRSLSRATNRFWGSLEKLEKTLPEAEAEEESATKVYLDRRSSENSYGWSFFFFSPTPFCKEINLMNTFFSFSVVWLNNQKWLLRQSHALLTGHDPIGRPSSTKIASHHMINRYQQISTELPKSRCHIEEVVSSRAMPKFSSDG